MKRITPFQWVAVLTLAIALAPGAASAQEADTLSISGTFQAEGGLYPGLIGDDLAEVLANGNDHGWTLSLHGVSYSHDYSYAESTDEWGSSYLEQYITRVHATSFDFQFIGPDAVVLNEVVSQQLVSGSLPDSAFVELWNGDYFDSNFPSKSGPYSSFAIGLRSLDAATGVSVFVQGYWKYWALYSTDEFGYPLVEQQRLRAFDSVIYDYRPGNEGGLSSRDDLVDIGSSEPPVLPAPPPTLTIADGSAWEGNRGTTRLDLTVTLSRYPDDVVTVDYQTTDGSARNRSDYNATSGTLTFMPGEISRTISVSIKGDRKREADETFFVQLSNAEGATIADGVATFTILNDD